MKKRISGLIGEFKAFAFKGTGVDMAVGVMIGGAFGKISTSLVNDIFMPLISLMLGRVNISDWFVALDGLRDRGGVGAVAYAQRTLPTTA